ncbi:hypothetical protein JB92DRAFT_640993 [Gautieria morchelliformis]|nr:hypothetical protein JB92DRAFT_640993 [Gautieria morchelliformis]
MCQVHPGAFHATGLTAAIRSGLCSLLSTISLPLAAVSSFHVLSQPAPYRECTFPVASQPRVSRAASHSLSPSPLFILRRPRSESITLLHAAHLPRAATQEPRDEQSHLFFCTPLLGLSGIS